MPTAFVTGATGLLGNNLVRTLLQQGHTVRALVRSAEKAHRQFPPHPLLTIIEGDMENIVPFASSLAGCDIIYHTAAYFRESYGGGNHWNKLRAINVEGTASLIDAAYAAGIRKFIHVSSIAVLDGPRGALINESMTRSESDADDYYRSKILADQVIFNALKRYPDLFACFVLPGWMHGPGDMGPTSAGQFTLDYMAKRLPGIPPGSFAFVDARDVATALIAAGEKGRRGERYLAAGRHMPMAELMAVYESVTGIAAPKRHVPKPLLWVIAGVQEIAAKVTKKPALLSIATVRLMLKEADRTRFDHRKSQTELGISFRPMAETIRDEINWLRESSMV